MHCSRYFLLSICVLTLAGCMQQPTPIPTLSPQIRAAYLKSLDTWQATGRVAISNKQEGYTASIEWMQQQQNYDLHFWGPLSSGAVHIIGKPGTVTLSTSDGQSYDGTDPESLVEERLGWELPLKGLVYWIKGQATTHSNPQVTKYDQHNQLQVLEQDGWHINYQSYSAFENFSLPEKITMTKDSIKLRIIINDWQSR